MDPVEKNVEAEARDKSLREVRCNLATLKLSAKYGEVYAQNQLGHVSALRVMGMTRSFLPLPFSLTRKCLWSISERLSDTSSLKRSPEL